MIEKRQSARRLLHFCPRESTVVFNGRLIGSAVLDESTGGVSIFVTDPRELHDGDLIEYVDATDPNCRIKKSQKSR